MPRNVNTSRQVFRHDEQGGAGNDEGGFHIYAAAKYWELAIAGLALEGLMKEQTPAPEDFNLGVNDGPAAG